MKFYLYILQTFDNTLYCGIAKDVLARFELHKNKKGAKYTKIHKPKEIVYVDEFCDKSSALKEEYRIKKTLSREQKFDIINKNKEKTKEILNSLEKNFL